MNIKKRVHATPPINVDGLRIRITAKVNILKENPDLIKKVMRSMRKRAQVCVNRNGGQVEGKGQQRQLFSIKNRFVFYYFKYQVLVKYNTMYRHRCFLHKGS